MNASEQTSGLGAVWKKLIAGELSVSAVGSSLHGECIDLRLNPTRRPIKPAEAHILLRVLCGEQQKVVAAETPCSISTIAGTATKCLQVLGLSCGAREAPFALIVLAHACTKPLPSEFVDCSVQTNGELTTLNFAKPRLPVDAGLSPGEHAVLELLLQGLSHHTIADRRQTSARTIANQLASAYAKLGVSGRLQVLRKLLAPQAELTPCSRAA